MIVILSGTNRPGSNTRKVATQLAAMVAEHGAEPHLLDLAELPPAVFSPSAYESKPAAFAPFQEAILAADGLLTVTPEYNGSFPGVLKYFIDMLQFPESLLEKPAAFVGLAAGRWGALRAVEQLEMIFQYRSAHLFGRRVFIPGVAKELAVNGKLVDPELAARLRAFAGGFCDFCAALDGVCG